jgi:hypothetical protein
MERMRHIWKRISPYAVGLAVLGAVGVGAYERYGKDCCHPGSACCYPGSPCCHHANTPS